MQCEFFPALTNFTSHDVLADIERFIIIFSLINFQCTNDSFKLFDSINLR